MQNALYKSIRFINTSIGLLIFYFNLKNLITLFCFHCSFLRLKSEAHHAGFICRNNEKFPFKIKFKRVGRSLNYLHNIPINLKLF